MLGYLKALHAHRELLTIWTWREIRVRYKQSALGAAWAILQPVVLMVVFTFIFSRLIKVPSDGIPYPIFSYTALLAWTFFATSVSFAIPSLVNNLNLVTKVYFPREILPMASIGAAFVDFLVAGAVLVVALIWYQTPLTAALLWLPAITALQGLLILGVVLPAAALNVAYRDVRFVVPLGLQLWLYATPVVYPISLIPEGLRPLYLLNPMAGIVESFRRVLLLGQPPMPEQLGISAAVTLLLVLAGYTYFKRAERGFADVI